MLGNNADEQNRRRRVLINVAVRIPDGVCQACVSDQLDQTICYAGIADFIDDIFATRKFNLLEKATQFLYDALSTYLHQRIGGKKQCLQQRVEILKPSSFRDRPGDASFMCSDW
jgi:dihydroneopterin aldolase